MGVCRAAHLSALTMEDYPNLGIRSMEDRTRLFQLVQLVKTLDLEGCRYGDDYHDHDYEVDGDDEEDASDDGGFTYSGDDVNVMREDRGHEDNVYNDEMEAATARLNTATASRPPVRRRLDFSCAVVDSHQKHFHSPIGSVNVCAGHDPGGNDGSLRAKGSTIPGQLDMDTGSVVSHCRCHRSHNNHRPDIHHHTHDHHTGTNAKPDITRQLPSGKSQTRSSPKHGSIHKMNPRHLTGASKYSKKAAGHKDRMAVSRRAKPDAGTENNGTHMHTVKPTPVYESKRAAGYNYGLPLSSPPAPNRT